MIWSLVRKPGAFATYRYRQDLFPTLVFRRTYDRLCQTGPIGADRAYLAVLALAAGLGESVVETALRMLLDAGRLPTTTPTVAAITNVTALAQRYQRLHLPDSACLSISSPFLDHVPAATRSGPTVTAMASQHLR